MNCRRPIDWDNVARSWAETRPKPRTIAAYADPYTVLIARIRRKGAACIPYPTARAGSDAASDTRAIDDNARHGRSRPTPTRQRDPAAARPIALPTAKARTVTSMAPTSPSDRIAQWMSSAIITRRTTLIMSSTFVLAYTRSRPSIGIAAKKTAAAPTMKIGTLAAYVSVKSMTMRSRATTRSRAPNGKNTMASFRTVSCHRSITWDSRPSWMAVDIPTIMTLQPVVATRSTHG